MRLFLAALLALGPWPPELRAQGPAVGSDLTLASPDKRLEIQVANRHKIHYSVLFKGQRVLDFSPISLQLSDRQLGVETQVQAVKRTEVRQDVAPAWGSRRRVREHYNQLRVECRGNFAVEFRAYNDGVAYRIVTELPRKEITVVQEEVAYHFPFKTGAWLLDGQSYESNFQRTTLDVAEITNFKNAKDKIFLPAVVQPTAGVKLLLTEANLRDYPSLFLKRGNDYEDVLTGTFEPVALTTKPGEFNDYAEVANQTAPYTARTAGRRTFPWRVLVVSDNDATFADCDLVYLLADPSEVAETAWIKPGKVAWEWWHDYAVTGQDFEGGVNTNTYLYQTDFAARYGLPYILVDWQWTDKRDVTLVNPAVDIRRIIQYAQGKGVRVLLWCPAHSLHRQLDQALDYFAQLGAAGVKTDFFGREDQTGIRMYSDIARAAARRRLLVDFHGCTKPTGLSRTFPNIVNYEAVLGNEYNKLQDKCTVNHKMLLPFTRGAIGPMDFTPGGMRNRGSGAFATFYTLPLVHGTRCNELATYVLYDEPLKMLCDAPAAYEAEPEYTRFLAAIPTTWDESMVLTAKFGECLVKARKTQNVWYVAGMSDEAAREVEVDLSFLGAGEYKAVLYRDGANAARVATDYRREEPAVTAGTKLPLHLAGGGGFVLRLEPR